MRFFVSGRIQAMVWIAGYVAIATWSAWNPVERLTWWLEVSPALIGFLALAITQKRFRLTPILYWVILAHCAVLFVGGRYTYAEVPLPNLFGDLFGQGRNNFDKIGHFIQGVTPAMLAREVYLRTSPLKPGKWLGFITVCTALAFSAFYELIEWFIGAFYGSESDAFLGVQGYVWDTQSDMLMALIGAMCAMLLLSGFQDRAMRNRGQIK
jgi:putative membrane protein